MWFLRRRCLQSAWRVGVALAFVATFFASVRLLPWWVRSDVVGASMTPLVVVALSTVAEVLAVALPPLAFGLGVVAAAEHGELRAVASLGTRPSRLAWAVAPLAVPLVFACGVVLQLTPPPSRSLGRLAVDLVETSRAACEGRSHSTVPVLGYTWLCREPGPPVLVGHLQAGVWFAADGLEVGAGGRVTLRRAHFRTSGPGTDSGVRIDAQVADVTMSGFGVVPGAWERRVRALTPCVSGLVAGPLAVLLLVWARVRSVTVALLLLMPGPILYLGTIQAGGGLATHAPLSALVISWLGLCSTVLLYRRLCSLGWPRASFVGSSIRR